MRLEISVWVMRQPYAIAQRADNAAETNRDACLGKHGDGVVAHPAASAALAPRTARREVNVRRDPAHRATLVRGVHSN